MRYSILISMSVLLAAASAAVLHDPAPASASTTLVRPDPTQESIPGDDTLLLARGKAIVGTVCAACHTEQPPPKLAPPLSHVARRYRMMTSDSAAALQRMTAWIAAPSKDRSLMPGMAIDRFGLMAPLPIPEDQRRAAATYVLSLADSARGMGGDAGMAVPGMRGMQGMQGKQGMQGMQGMRHGARATRDTTR